MNEIPTYYVTLKPIREGAQPAFGWRNIAFVPDPAIDEVGVYLSEHDQRVVADDNVQSLILEYLKGCGVVKPENWREVTEEEYLEARSVNLGVEDSESYNDLQKKGGGGQWLVRYEYSGPVDEKTRDFCREVISLGKLYTEEEIKNGLSNPEFGDYSIFDYKGSYGCRHVWKRRIYFEDYEDNEVRRVGFVPQVVSRLDDKMATTLNAYLSKDEQMQVVAPLLIPDKKIFRNDEIGRYNMEFSRETIKELFDVALSRDVLEKEDLFKDTHEGSTAPAYVLDAWISEDENDKAYTQFGFGLSRTPIGTLFVHSQVTDKDYWTKEIKGNKKYAYSIEALMNLSIVKLSKMEKEQIVLPDGEHLINGTIYVVEGGVVVSTKEVTPEQEEVIEDVAEEAAPEEMAEEAVVEKAPATPEATTEAPVEDERLAKLEAAQEELMSEIAKLKGELEAPKVEDVAVAMSDERPLWKRFSDGINAIKKQK
jgi:hypothetical protein